MLFSYTDHVILFIVIKKDMGIYNTRLVFILYFLFITFLGADSALLATFTRLVSLAQLSIFSAPLPRCPCPPMLTTVSNPAHHVYPLHNIHSAHPMRLCPSYTPALIPSTGPISSVSGLLLSSQSTFLRFSQTSCHKMCTSIRILHAFTSGVGDMSRP